MASRYMESITFVPLNGSAFFQKIGTSFEHSDHVFAKQSEKNLGFQQFYYWATKVIFIPILHLGTKFLFAGKKLQVFTWVGLQFQYLSTVLESIFRNIEHNTFICKENEHNPACFTTKYVRQKKIGLLEHIGSIPLLPEQPSNENVLKAFFLVNYAYQYNNDTINYIAFHFMYRNNRQISLETWKFVIQT